MDKIFSSAGKFLKHIAWNNKALLNISVPEYLRCAKVNWIPNCEQSLPSFHRENDSIFRGFLLIGVSYKKCYTYQDATSAKSKNYSNKCHSNC